MNVKRLMMYVMASKISGKINGKLMLLQVMRKLKEKKSTSKFFILSLANPLPEKGKAKMIPSERAKILKMPLWKLL